MTFHFTVAVGVVVAGLCAAAPAISQDAEAGEKIFKKCKACHSVGEDAINGPGPVLNNVIGRAAGSFEGFKYGKGMLEASNMGLVWSERMIAEYITDPKKYLRAFTGNQKAKAKMTFKLNDEQQRLDVIAYLSGFSSGSELGSDTNDSATNVVTAPTDIPENAVCVQNASAHTHFFAAEAIEGSRVTQELQFGEILCTAAMDEPLHGTVSVFEHEDEFEGCTRIVRSGMVEQMKKYSEFDRCLWSSNDS